MTRCWREPDSNHRSRFPERPTWGVDNEHYHLSDVYLDRFNYPGLIGTPLIGIVWKVTAN
jgi:hypothetical protein